MTSLDEASLEPAIAARSFLQPGLHVTESVNSNLGKRDTVGITRLLGSLDLTRLWSRYTFSANYVGGASLYSDSFDQPSQVHELAASQRYAWRTGQLQVRDGLTYLPEGSFGFSGFGGAGGGGSSGGGGFGGGNTFGSLGTDPRLTNAVTVDVRESLNPRSSLTVAGGYTFTDFLNSANPGTVNSRQVSAQAGYSRALNHFDQLGLQYGFQQFQFPLQGAGTIDSHTVQVLYQHQISGRMDLVLGGGPQVTTIMVPANLAAIPPTQASTTTKISASVRSSLRYRLQRASIALTYDRHTTAGSGIHLGSQSDVARFTYQRPLSRLWNSTLDVGYSRHTALQAAQGNALGGAYQSGFAGGGLNRRLGRFFSVQIHYQYDYEYFDGKSCNPALSNCSPSINSHYLNRHIGDLTLSWHPAPIRLD